MEYSEHRKGQVHRISIDERFGSDTGRHIYSNWLRMVNEITGPGHKGLLGAHQVMALSSRVGSFKLHCYLDEAESLAAEQNNPASVLEEIQILRSDFETLCAAGDDIGITHASKRIEKELVDCLCQAGVSGFSPVVARTEDPFRDAFSARSEAREFDMA
ncbi:hypothetical protein [Pseudosulfitobacter pseudonitzschiae]|uniref:hypothetical protein n=1 Tax=Pseudosulfitobacter pseudonitzschiae TaxID=1402135 RepID=UPI003B7DAC03